MILAFVVLAALHIGNDGLWFGDAPVHAGSGLYWWDLLTMWPSDPIAFTVRYFARYPIVQPTTYPPLFYIVEGLAFASGGPSPHVAKLVVLPFGIGTGLYTMAWGRRWIGATAGWSGTFLAFIPGILIWSNAVMLNIPATALGLASLYHFRRWIDTSATKHIVLAACLFAAVLLTYYPGAVVIAVIAAFAAHRWRDIRFGRGTLWIAAITTTAALPLVVSILMSPVHTSRHTPSLTFLTRPSTWMLYWYVLPGVIGWTPLTLVSGFGVLALATARWRKEALLMLIWILTLIGVLSLLPARDPRYILLAAPAFVLLVACGVSAAVPRLPAVSTQWSALALVITLAAGLWYGARVRVPEVSGFRDIALYLAQQGPQDAVLYDGPNSALLTFYVRALDPDFNRRVTQAGHLLYHYGPGRTFSDWTQTSNVATTDDVVRLLRERCGCQWVAIEAWSQSAAVTGRQLLRAAVERPDFVFVRSFPVTGVYADRVDLYRLVGDVEPVTTLNLSFPSFSFREFQAVVPITRQRDGRP